MAWLNRPKNKVASDPSEVTQEMPYPGKTPESKVAKDHLMKDIIQ